MKRNGYVCACLLAALLQAGCGRALASGGAETPEAPEAPPVCASPMKNERTPSAPDMEGLMELLDRAGELQPCSAGSSLRAAALAGGLLEWLGAGPVPEELARRAALRWAAGKSPSERLEAGRALRLLGDAARRMGEEELRALLEDAGCPLPEESPEKDEYLRLTEALSLALTGEIFKNNGENMNIYS